MEANTQPQTEQVHFMDGTESQGSYIVFARSGKIALGFRSYPPVFGEKIGIPGKTMLSGRIRSALGKDLFGQADHENGSDNVVSFSAMVEQNQKALDAAWPNIKFDRVDDTRASTSFGNLIRGSLETNPEDFIDMVLNHGQTLANGFAQGLIDLVGEDQMLLSKETFAKAIYAQQQPMFQALADMLEAKKAMQVEAEANVGVFGLQSEILKSLFKPKPPIVAQAQPVEDVVIEESEDPQIGEEVQTMDEDEASDPEHDGEDNTAS